MKMRKKKKDQIEFYYFSPLTKINLQAIIQCHCRNQRRKSQTNFRVIVRKKFFFLNGLEVILVEFHGKC